MMKRWLALGVVLTAAAVWSAGCGDDDDSSNSGSNLKTCPSNGGSGGSSSGPSACGTCQQQNCSAEASECFDANNGACLPWVNAGCKDLPDAACSACVQKVVSCGQSKCASECNQGQSGSGGSGGSNSGGSGGSGGSGSTLSCAQLAACCTTLPGGDQVQKPCSDVAAMNNEASCGQLGASYQSAGYCK